MLFSKFCVWPVEEYYWSASTHLIQHVICRKADASTHVLWQGWTWSEQYQQYGIFGYDESGLFRWYPAPPVRVSLLLLAS